MPMHHFTSERERLRSDILLDNAHRLIGPEAPCFNYDLVLTEEANLLNNSDRSEVAFGRTIGIIDYKFSPDPEILPDASHLTWAIRNQLAAAMSQDVPLWLCLWTPGPWVFRQQMVEADKWGRPALVDDTLQVLEWHEWRRWHHDVRGKRWNPDFMPDPPGDDAFRTTDEIIADEMAEYFSAYHLSSVDKRIVRQFADRIIRSLS